MAAKGTQWEGHNGSQRDTVGGAWQPMGHSGRGIMAAKGTVGGA